MGRPGSYLYMFESYRMEEVCRNTHAHTISVKPQRDKKMSNQTPDIKS